MVLKKSTINILRMLEIKKIKKTSMSVKKLFFAQNSSMQQLHVLSKYQSDYYIEFFQKFKLGISNINWKNYIGFLEMLNKGIKQQKDINMIYKNKIEKKLLKLSYMYNKIQLWKLLEYQNTNDTLKRKIELDQLKVDELFQIYILKDK